MIVVTGGLGFIGTALCVELARSGREVLAIDVDGAENRLPDDVASRVAIHRGDARNFDAIHAVLSGRAADAIVHLAAHVDPASRTRTICGNLEMLAGMFDLAARAGAATLLHASSLAVYFGARTGPFRERQPLSMSSATRVESIKKVDEIAARFAAATSDFNIATVRLGNVYGPGYRSLANPPSQYCRLALGAMSADAVTDWHGSPFSKAQDYIHVFDAARGLATLAIADVLPSDCYNLSGGVAASPADIARLVSEISGVALAGVDGPTANAKRRLDMSRLDELGWAPTLSLAGGLRQYLDWLREHAY